MSRDPANRWFAHDVTAAMLVVKNKSISLLWELNSNFHLNSLRKNSIVLTPNMTALSRGCKPRIVRWELEILSRDCLGLSGKLSIKLNQLTYLMTAEYKVEKTEALL